MTRIVGTRSGGRGGERVYQYVRERRKNMGSWEKDKERKSGVDGRERERERPQESFVGCFTFT